MANSIGNDVVALEGVKIGWPNFSGATGPFNKDGKRMFTIFLPEDVAEEMAALGWPVKFPEAQEANPEDDYQQDARIQVSLKMDGARPPKIALIGTGAPTLLTADTVGIVDTSAINFVDVVFRAYNWEMNGKTGKSAWLKEIYVNLDTGTFADKYGI